jgi:hypothetical protein
VTGRTHLESAHSVFLAILARGDILQDEIPQYIRYVYAVTAPLSLIQAFPMVLSPRQFRLAFSTVVKLSTATQVNAILTELLEYGKTSTDRVVFLLAMIDCLPWINEDAIQFWLDQIGVSIRTMQQPHRESAQSRLWECISGEIAGERGIKALSWWINNSPQILSHI